MWTTHADTMFVVEEAWNRQEQFATRIRHTKAALKKWNTLVFGHVQHQIKGIKNSIQQLQNQTQSQDVLN